MTRIELIRSAVDILSLDHQFDGIEFIAVLNWKEIPKAYKIDKTIILNTNRVNVYKLDTKMVVEIVGLGLFQIS